MYLVHRPRCTLPTLNKHPRSDLTRSLVGHSSSTGRAPRERSGEALSTGKAAFFGRGLSPAESKIRTVRRVTRRAGARQVSCRAGAMEQLPIFPMNMVGLPSARVTLHIFEARYRVLFNTLLDGLEDVDEGMVQKESKFCGTKRFGLLYVDPKGKISSVGCKLEIEHHKQLADGRMMVVSRGVERFKIRKVIQEKPVLLAEVEILEDEEEEAGLQECEGLAAEVRELFCSTLTLGKKMQGKAPQGKFPGELFELPAQRLSFWIASMLSGAEEQQKLLEMPSVKQRLDREKELLKGTLDYLSATSALKGALGEMDDA